MGEGTAYDVAAGRRHIIERPRLTRLLDETDSRIIMLVAPAGYGKTTLARQWLADKTHAWCRLRPASADLVALALEIADAASAIGGEKATLRKRLRIPYESTERLQTFIKLVVEEVADWPPDSWLVFDDYQHLAGSAAETFLKGISESAGVRMFVTSRQRPPWVTARRLLYGEVYELGQAALSMTDQEANALLARTNREDASELADLATGWPAALGLAALTEQPITPAGVIPNALYDFLAEELFREADPETRRSLRLLATAPSSDSEIARALFGDASKNVLAEGMRLGFMTPSSDSEVELHPLARTFLASHHSEDEQAPATEHALVVRTLLTLHRWDDAFAVIERFALWEVFDTFLTQSLDDMLVLGRLATVAHWIAAGRAGGVWSAAIDIADASLGFRQGRYDEAESLAMHAAETLGAGDPRLARALLLAGQSAHLQDREEPALARFESARGAAGNPADTREAIWGQFVASVDLDSEEAVHFLHEYEAVAGNRPDDRLRLINGQLTLANRYGGIREAVERASLYERLLRHSDPVIRCAFLHVFGCSLMMLSRYDDGIDAIEGAKGVARDYGLDFALPHALIVQAALELGRRRFDASGAVLDMLDVIALDGADMRIALNARVIRMKLLLAQGSFEAALLIGGAPVEGPVAPGLHGELLATQAVALACCGRNKESCALASRAERRTQQLEAQILAACARAIMQLNDGATAGIEGARLAFRAAWKTGDLHDFVLAYRASPTLLLPIAEDITLRSSVLRLIRAAHDDSLGQRLGLTTASKRPRRHGQLSNRELEVCHLVAQGLTNKELARTLFITEMTVKAHMRHIFEKLGVRSRAAIAARVASGLH